MATGVAASAKTILVWSRPPSITLLVNHIPPSAGSRSRYVVSHSSRLLNNRWGLTSTVYLLVWSDLSLCVVTSFPRTAMFIHCFACLSGPALDV